MKRTLAVMLMVSLGSSPLYATDATTQADRLRKANTTFWAGVVLAVSGLVLMPMTAGPGGNSAPNESEAFWGLGLTAAGTVLVWKGAQDRRKASSPETTIGIFTGHSTGVQLRRRW